jgi:hypothetical protein
MSASQRSLPSLIFALQSPNSSSLVVYRCLHGNSFAFLSPNLVLKISGLLCLLANFFMKHFDLASLILDLLLKLSFPMLCSPKFLP